MSKPRKCKVCGDEYQPFNSIQKVCGPKCAIELVKQDNAKKLAKDQKIKEKLERHDLKRRRKALKRNSEYLSEAQTDCNKYIRLRDINEPCPSCGKFDHEIPDIFVGGKWDAGHFKSRGAYPELRFNENNIHKQCKSCNGGSGKFSHKEKTVSEAYRINLIKKIGIDKVEWLEGPHEPQKWTIEDLEEIRQYYKDKFKELSDV